AGHRKCWNLEFQCLNGECLRPGYLCDNHTDCKDGSDETDCSSDAFVLCGDGSQKHRSYWCDDWPDCPDNHADEKNCMHCDDEDRFMCPNGRCIKRANVCDSQCDCVEPVGDPLAPCPDEINCEEYYTIYHGSSDRCIQEKYLCDGVNHCHNGNFLSDEFGCGITSPENGSFRCLDNRTLPGSLKCDRKYDCLHGDDEVDCPMITECDAGQFLCKSGQCVEETSRCNVTFECWDKSDEIGCHDVPCNSNLIKCDLGGQCIPKERWCDYFVDCPDGSDEKNCDLIECTSEEFQCDNGQCIDRRYHCYNSGNSHEACADMSHLQNCSDWECRHNEFKCHRGPCLNTSLLCNGKIDCQHTWEDEDGCPFPCSILASQCECRDVHINCTGLGLTVVPTDTEKEITWFHLGSNYFNVTLTNETFLTLNRLLYLDLSNNSIAVLLPMMFSSLWRLTVLNLQNNDIHELNNGSFYGLPNVKGLHLQGNKIRTLNAMAFYGLSSLTNLDLHHQNINCIRPDTFIGLRSLVGLDLSQNKIEYLDEGSFRGMPHLLYLSFSDNNLYNSDNSLITCSSICPFRITDEFRFCCLARHVEVCFPPPDEFSSCEDLMSNLVLRVCVWALALVAIFGNLLVIGWRAKYKHCNQVHSFLITNLALGDLLMGSYLLLIALVDWHYRGVYFIYDSSWRSSPWCSFAGFISTFSSELSVFTLTVITLDRFLVIIFPFRVRRLEMTRTRLLMALGWIFAAALSAIPLVHIEYFRNFYGRSGVCLALHITPDKPSGWEYSVFVFLFLNLLSFTIIAVGYLWMFLVARTTQHAVHKERRTSESAMAWRMTLLVVTDAACWVPIILLGVVSLAGFTVPPQVFAWVAVFILPLNAAVNPVLYTLSTAPFLTPARHGFLSFRRSCKLSLSADQRRSYTSAIHSHNYTGKE
ncbi:hypothetical protein AAG570_013549, partial [Ranatra chinensis]